MGLDMFLRRKKYISEKDRHKLKISGIQVDAEKVCYIEEEVMYWRKADAVHDWFVDNCQEGVDDCRTAMVSKKQLKELYDICYQILNEKNKEKQQTLIEELLSVQEGCALGENEYFFEYVKETYEILAKVLMVEKLTGEEDYEYYYNSSW